MHPADLETLVDRELRDLPSPRAPHTLLPRVMAAVEQLSRRPWYTRAWLTWPLGWQLASLAALALVVAGGTVLIPGAQAAAGDVTSRLVPAVSRFVPGAVSDVLAAASRVDATMNAGRVVWRTLVEPLATYAFVIVALMCGACAAFGTALNRVAFGRS